MSLADAFVRSGKVRDLFALDERSLLLVASDRLSAFDVVLPTAIPDKGRILTGLSRFWFAQTGGVVPNHLLSCDPADLPPGWASGATARADLRGRMMICQRASVLPVEVIVRGYLAGSGWKEYRQSGAVCGIALPPGLRDGSKLEPAIFTPATKAEVGAHDENISFAQVEKMIGKERAAEIREVSIRLYREAADYARERGIIIADTKFEFGTGGNGELVLIDDPIAMRDAYAAGNIHIGWATLDMVPLFLEGLRVG